MFNLAYIKKIKTYIGKEVLKFLYLSIFVGLCTFLIEAIFIVVLQKFLQSIGILNNTIQSNYFSFLNNMLWSSAALVLIGAIRAMIYGLKSYSANLTQHTFICLRRVAILTAALHNSAATSTKEVVSIFSDLVSAAGSLLNYLSLFLINLISAIAYFSLALYIAPNETALGIFLIVVLLYPTRSLSKKVTSSGEALVREWEKVNGSLITGLKNNFFLKVYNLIPQEVAFAENSVMAYRNHIKQFSITSSLVASLPSIVGLLVLAILTYFSLKLGSSTIKLIGFFYIFLKLVQSLSELNQTYAAIRLNQPSLLRLIEWENRIRQGADFKIGKATNSRQSISKIDRISANIHSFAYGNEIILENINLELRPGDTLIIKGPSGAGKSTLLGLLLGILKPQSGTVLVNSMPVSDVIFNNSRLVAYVGPEPFLIQGTLRENLLYGLNEHVVDTDILTSLKIAGLNDLVVNLPNQLDQNISEVAELSTGQKQRLSLARALIRPFDILVLDEATANLDPQTEKEIIHSIAPLLKNKISIIVTHKATFDSIGTKFLEIKIRS